MKNKSIRIMNEITNFCEQCASKDCCPEEYCVLYRIEKILFEKKKEKKKNAKQVKSN